MKRSETNINHNVNAPRRDSRHAGMARIMAVVAAVVLFTAKANAQDLLRPEAWFPSEDFMTYNLACYNKLVHQRANTLYMCRPAFSAEYALSVVTNPYNRTSSWLELRRAKENIWYHDNFSTVGKQIRRQRMKEEPGRHDVEVETFTLAVKGETLRLIAALVKASTETATYFNGEPNGCDGVTYIFYTYGMAGRLAGRAWSPEKGCRTRRLVDAMDSICLAVQKGDTNVLNRQMPLCRTLLHEFRREYPPRAFEPQTVKYGYVDSTGHHYVREVGTEQVKVCRRSDTLMSEEQSNMWSASIAGRVAALSRKLFLGEGTELVRIVIQIVENGPTLFFKDGYGYCYFCMPTTDGFEERCLSAPLQKDGCWHLEEDGQWHQVDADEAKKWF